MKRDVETIGKESSGERIADEEAKKGKDGHERLETSVSIPAKVSSAKQLDAVIAELEELKTQARLYEEISVLISLKTDEA